MSVRRMAQYIFFDSLSMNEEDFFRGSISVGAFYVISTILLKKVKKYL